MKQYLDLLKRLLVEGDRQFNERTGYLMIGKAGHQSLYDVRKGFPATTTKPLFFRGVAEELFWFARGERNVKTLIDKGIHIWDRNAYQHFLKRHGLDGKVKKNTDEWEQGCKDYIEKISKDDDFAQKEGDLGPIYGYQWRHRQTRDGREIDQLKDRVIENLRKDPGTRYAIMNAWDPEDIGKMALAPCHCFVQFNVFEDRFLDVNMYQRSCDVFLGVPFNIASYPLLGSLLAKELNLEMREFYHSYGNVHIYAGVPPRSEFLKDDGNLEEFRGRVREARKAEDYLEAREWYLKNAPSEGEGSLHKRKDHIPFILEQLSYEPRKLPSLEIISEGSFFDLINKPVKDVVRLKGYDPIKWDSKAVMAA